MSLIFWILISIAVLVVLIAVVFIFLLSKKKIPHREPDYYAWFWIGLIWVCAGIPLGVVNYNYGLFAIGLVFMVLGLVHKKDWKKNHIKFQDLTPIEKKFKTWTMLILGILILGGAIAFLIFRF